MGNLLGRNRAKVMKITGESFRIKTPAVAGEALQGHPDHVLLNANAVKHFGAKAKPLHPGQLLRPNKLYFLVRLPKFHEETPPRQPTNHPRPDFSEGGGGKVRVKVRMRRAQVEKFMEESTSDAEVAEKIIDLCLASHHHPPAQKLMARPGSRWKPSLDSVTDTFSVYRQKKQIRFG